MAHLEVAADRRSILSRRLVLLLITAAGSMSSFYLLLSVVPWYAAVAGAGGLGAGLTTGAMMLSTVVTELAVPLLLARLGYRVVMGLGLFLLGAPALALLISPTLPLILAVCLTRGAGLGIVVVTATALVAELVPAQRRGEGLGLYGVVVTVTSIVGLPMGLWLSGHVGFRVTFVAAAVVSLVALAAVVGLPPLRLSQAQRRRSVLSGLRHGTLARPTLVFSAVTLAAGISVTFLPLAVPDRWRPLAAVALLVQACAAAVARWVAGRFSDRHGAHHLLIPAVLAAAAGTAALIWVANPIVVIVSMALFGVGFGMAQNVTLTLMFERVPQSRFGQVSALWNLAYDGGMGIGAVAFGLVAVRAGYPVGFALTGAVLFAALLPAWRDRDDQPAGAHVGDAAAAGR